MQLTATPNFRDLGGVHASDGRTVRRGLLFRSEAILEPIDEDARALRDAGIVLICDLRSGTERDHAPNRWWSDHGVELLDLDILADIRSSPMAWQVLRTDPTAAGALRVMQTIYRELPIAAAPHLATIFARIAAGDLPMLIHCTAGKDRTGFVCAAILAALDVTMDDIVADYLTSAGRANSAAVAHTRNMVLDRAGPGVTEEAIAALMGVERAYLDASFFRITTDFGSLDSYLKKAVGLDRDDRDALRGRLLADR